MSEIEIDQLIDSTRVDGSGAEVAPPSLAPLSAWSEVDPDYAEFATDDSDPDEDEDADDLTEEEIDAPEPDGDSDQVIEPVGIELWGQNVDEASEWVKVAEQDLDGDGEAGIAMIPNVPTATNMRYRLRLVYSDGSFSKWSEQQEVTTPRDMTPPPVPSAPQVTVRYGHAQGGWDGELAEEIPIDFDHTRFYVQQMEPESGEEPPEGGYVTGDPQLMTRFSSEGSHMLGFLPEAEHRAFLTSVDTSNNESARSEYTYFTPTPPVDREAIEEEVDKVEDRMDDLRETLEQGLSDEVTRLEGEIETAGGTTILRRTSEPTTEDGEGVAEGTIWYQYTTLDSGGELDGMWTWDGTDWVESTISEKIMAQVHIEQGTVGDLTFDRISGFAAQVQHLAIGNAENLFPEYWHGEDALGEYVYHTNYNLDATSRSRFFSEDPPVPSLWGTRVLNDRRGWQIAGAEGSQSIAFRMSQGRGIRVTPGERYAIQSLVRDFGGDSFLGWVIHFIHLDGSQGTSASDRIDLDISGRVHGASDTEGDTDTFQVPDLGWGPMDMVITLRHTGSSYSGTGQRTVMEPKLRKMMDGSVVVDGSLGAAKIDVEDLAASTARMETLWSGFAGFSEAQIDNLLANTGHFKTINAPLVQSHTQPDQGWKLNPVGDFEVYSPDGGSNLPMVRLGSPTTEGDLLNLRGEDGAPAITMTQDGGVSARHVSSEGDPHIGSKPLAGGVFESPRWFSAPSIMESLPQGIVAQYLRTFSSSDNTTIQASVAVAHLEARLVPGRLYRIGCDGFEMGSREPYFMEAFYTSSDTDSRPGMPHSGSIALGQHQGHLPPSDGNTNLGYEVMFNALTTRRIRLLFAIGVRGGGGKTFGSRTRHNARFYIEDLGPSIGFTGRSMLRSASTTSNIIPEIPEAVLQRYQVAGTATYSFDSSTGEATRQYIGGTPRFGEWTHTGQTHFTVVQFEPWDQAGTPTGTSLRFRVERWGSSRGHVVRNWLPDFTGLPSSFNLGQLTELPVQRNVGSAGIRAADLTREQEMDLAGRSNGSLVLGGPGWGAPNYAGAGVFNSNGVTASLSTEIEE